MKQETIQVHIEGFKDKYDHDYDVVKKEGSDDISLFRSQSKSWSNPGELIGSLVDSGDDITIILDGVPNLELDYVTAQELLILLYMNNTAKINFIKTETIKSIL